MAGGEIEVVDGGDDDAAVFRSNPAHDGEGFKLIADVERAGRLVQQQNRGRAG